MANNVNSYNLKGDVIGQVTLPEVFQVKPNEKLLSQFVRVYLANNRQGTRDTKDRAEVNGRAKKPYRQKGTGSARHGSKKAPSMRGGGVAHGPKPYDFSLKMSKTMRRNALLSAIAKKLDTILVLDKSNIEEIKTKNIVDFLVKTELNGSVLFVTGQVEKNFVLSSRNIPGVEVNTANTLNAYDVLKYSSIVLEKSALELIENKYKKEEVK